MSTGSRKKKRARKQAEGNNSNKYKNQEVTKVSERAEQAKSKTRKKLSQLEAQYEQTKKPEARERLQNEIIFLRASL